MFTKAANRSIGLLLGLSLLVACSNAPWSTSSAYPVPQPVVNVSVTTVVLGALEASPVLGVVLDQQYRIVYIEANQSAALAGIQVGDVLLQLDGIAVAGNVAQLREHLALKIPQDQVTARFNRAGKEIEMPVTLFRYGGPTTPQPASATVQILPTATPVLPPYDYL